MPKTQKPIIRLDGAKALARPHGLGSVRFAAAADSTEVFIYGEIGGWFGGVVAEDIVKEIGAIDTAKIDVRINSPGGAVFDGVAIYNALAAHDADVTVHVEGIAASIASVIAMAGDTIRIGEAANIMIHKPWSFAMGDASVLRKEAEVLDTLEGGLVDIYAARTGMKKAEISDLLTAETWYRGQAAVDAGFADICDPAKPKKPPKSDLLALFAHAPSDLSGDDAERPAVHEFERLLRDAERMPHSLAKRMAAMAARVFVPARDERDAGPRDVDGTTAALALRRLASEIRSFKR